ncbi:MAG: hypothetical protein F6K32_20075 [Desertifilum sp. SIO1I2]|nr:hypothetical protein [Desertifilum sp. SIO1I2]
MRASGNIRSEDRGLWRSPIGTKPKMETPTPLSAPRLGKFEQLFQKKRCSRGMRLLYPLCIWRTAYRE